jgi:hypothetical protein
MLFITAFCHIYLGYRKFLKLTHLCAETHHVLRGDIERQHHPARVHDRVETELGAVASTVKLKHTR